MDNYLPAAIVLTIFIFCLSIYLYIQKKRKASIGKIISKNHKDEIRYQEFKSVNPDDPIIRYNHYVPEYWIITVKLISKQTIDIYVSKDIWNKSQIGDDYIAPD